MEKSVSANRAATEGSGQRPDDFTNPLVLRPAELALAAIAAPLTFFAAMIGARVLGAMHADLGRRLAADVAHESDGIVH